MKTINSWNKNFLVFSFLLISVYSYSQNSEETELLMEAKGYKNVIAKSDSLLKAGKISNFNKEEVIALAKKLDKQYPLDYLSHSLQYLKEEKYNESAFFYFLAKMRVADFNANSIHHHYEGLGSDSDNYLNEVVVTYLAIDINNYKNILQESVDYYDKNSHSFFKNDKKYKKTEDPMEYRKIITEFELNPEKTSGELKEFWDDMATKIKNYFPY